MHIHVCICESTGTSDVVRKSYSQALLLLLLFFSTEASDPDSGGNTPATTDIAVGVVVSVFVFLVIVTVVVIIVFCLVVKSSNSHSYKPDRFPSVDNSPSSSYDGTPPDFPSIDNTPDLSRKINGGHELKDLGDGPFMAKSPLTPSGPIKVEAFAQHVEMFDSNRQLLFQEEYEVSSPTSYYVNN